MSNFKKQLNFMSNKKGFSKVAIIIIVLIVIGGAYFVFSKKDRGVSVQDAENQNSQSSNLLTDQLSIDNWKTYRNDQYGLEFKYPVDWKIQEYKIGNINNGVFIGLDPLETISQSSFETLDRTPGLITISLGKENPANVLEKGYFESLEKSEIGQGISARKTEEKTGENDAPNPYYFNRHILTYYFGNRTNYLGNYVESDFEVKYVSNLDDKYLKTFDQILSTFKFTK